MTARIGPIDSNSVSKLEAIPVIMRAHSIAKIEKLRPDYRSRW